METIEKAPETLMEAVKYFADLNVCHAYMTKVKWPDGHVTCPKCGGDKVGIIASRYMFQCKNKDCRKQFSAKVRTIFEDSPLGLDKWFVAVWCITNAKNGISSCELARAIGITQKSAWHMLHRIRAALKGGGFTKMSGTVEADECYVGGKIENFSNAKKAELRAQVTARRPGRPVNLGRVSKKTIVMGLLERGQNGDPSQVRATVIEKARRPHVAEVIKEHVNPGSFVMTDSLSSYKWLGDGGFIHMAVDHAIKYAEGRIHTNGIENFWSLMARMIHGTYVAIEPFHMNAYLDEQCWRFNNRKLTDSERFMLALPGVIGKRMTYAELTGKIAGEQI